jgi:magnesium-protoporphyrin O-methyltransferase
MLEAIRAARLRNAHLLDIGAGIGVIHHELIGTSVNGATHVEAAPAYIAVAQAEDERRRHRDRVEYLVGDVVALESSLPRADVVTLDRVICCYPDWEALVRSSAGKADRFFVFSMPHDRWYVRLVMAFENLGRRLRRNQFRTFVHPVAAVDCVLARMGFGQSYVRRTLAWHVALYTRG